jgi:hypothetical protein
MIYRVLKEDGAMPEEDGKKRPKPNANKEEGADDSWPEPLRLPEPKKGPAPPLLPGEDE